MRHAITVWVALWGLALIPAAMATAEPRALSLDKGHSRLEFVAFTHLFEVKGTFGDFEIWLDGDPKQPETCSVRMHVHAASVTTHYDEQDAALRGDAFLDAHAHPVIEFVSSRVREAKGGKLLMDGKLTIRGRTHPVSFELRVSRGNDLKGRPTTSYRGTATIDRTAYDIGDGKLVADLALQDEVELRFTVVAMH